jgi:cytoskeletal protein CcmA (bactofilin family)
MKNFFAKTSFMLLAMFFFGIAEARLTTRDFLGGNGNVCLTGVEAGTDNVPFILGGVIALESGLLPRMRKDGHITKGMDSGGRRIYLKDEGKDGVSRLIRKVFPNVEGGAMVILSSDAEREVDKMGSLGEKEWGNLLKEVDEGGKGKKKKGGGAEGDVAIKAKKYIEGFADSLLYIEQKRRMKKEGEGASKEKEIDLSPVDFEWFLGKGKEKGVSKALIDQALADEEKYGYPEHTVENVILAFIAKFSPNASFLAKFYEIYKSRRGKFFHNESEGKIEGGCLVSEFGAGDREILEKIVRYFGVEKWIYNAPCDYNPRTNKFDENGDVKKDEQPFADCQENAFRGIISALLGYKGIEELLKTGKMGDGTVASKDNRIGEIKDFYKNVSEKNYNSSLPVDHTRWNGVICNLKGVRYVERKSSGPDVCKKNESEPGYVNLIHILAALLGEKSAFPYPSAGAECDEEALKQELLRLFRIVNPDCDYELSFENLRVSSECGKAKSGDVFGKLKVEMKKDGKCFHKLTIFQDPDHGSVEFENLNKAEGIECQKALEREAKKDNSPFKKTMGYLFREKFEGQNFSHRKLRYLWGEEEERVVKVTFSEFVKAFRAATGVTEKQELIGAIYQNSEEEGNEASLRVSIDDDSWKNDPVYKKYCRSIDIVEVGGGSSKKTFALDFSDWEGLRAVKILYGVEIKGGLDFSTCLNLKRVCLMSCTKVEGNLVLPESLEGLDMERECKVGGTIDISRCLNLNELEIEGRAGDRVVVDESPEWKRIDEETAVSGDMDFSKYKNLEFLTIGGKIGGGVVLPESLKRLWILKESKVSGAINISKCQNLVELHIEGEIKGNVVVDESSKRESIDEETAVSGDMDFSKYKNLEVLTIWGTIGGVVLPESLKRLWILKESKVSGAINISKCPNLVDLYIAGEIEGNLDVDEKLRITFLEGGVVGGNLSLGMEEGLWGTPVIEGVDVRGDLVVTGRLNGLEIDGECKIGGDLKLSKCNELKTLTISKGAKIGGNVDVPGSLEKLQICDWVKIGGKVDVSNCKKLKKVDIDEGVKIAKGLVLPGKKGDVAIEGKGVGNVTISYASASSSDDLNEEVIAEGENSDLEKGYAGGNMNAGNPAAPQQLVAVGER